MDLENLIKDTFTAHEHDTPDEAPVLAAVRRRTSRGRFLRSRPFAVAAGVVVVVAAAATVVALNRPADHGTADAARSSMPVANAPAKPAKPVIKDLVMPLSLGWLPSGKVTYIARRINMGGSADNPNKPVYDGEYLLDVKSGNQKLMVDVQEMRMMSPGEAMFKSGPGRAVTINGKAGVESSRSGGPGGYELYMTHPTGGSIYVNVAAEPGSTASAQQLIDTGRRIAQHISVPGSTKITPSYGLRDLPADKKICTFEVGQGTDPSELRRPPHTRYSLGTCTTMPSVNLDSAPAQTVDGAPGHPVQGHKTRYDGSTLWVLDAVGGGPIAISGTASEAELYDVANHLVLPH